MSMACTPMTKSYIHSRFRCISDGVRTCVYEALVQAYMKFHTSLHALCLTLPAWDEQISSRLMPQALNSSHGAKIESPFNAL